MEKINKLINENYLDLSTLIVFTRAEHSIHRKEYQTIKDHDLTAAQFGVLEALYVKGDLKIGQLIEKILTTSGNMTVVVRNLEKAGLVRKIEDPADKRSTIISLTDLGREKIEEILPSHYQNIIDIFSVLSDEEKMQLKEILKKLSQT